MVFRSRKKSRDRDHACHSLQGRPIVTDVGEVLSPWYAVVIALFLCSAHSAFGAEAPIDGAEEHDRGEISKLGLAGHTLYVGGWLATFLDKVSAGFLDGGEKLSPDGSDQMLSELITGVDDDQKAAAPTFRPNGEDPVGRWFSWGDHLRSEYEIEQFALVRWEDKADLF